MDQREDMFRIKREREELSGRLVITKSRNSLSTFMNAGWYSVAQLEKIIERVKSKRNN